MSLTICRKDKNSANVDPENHMTTDPIPRGCGSVAASQSSNITNKPRDGMGAASRIQVQGIYADPPNWTLYHTLHHTLYYPIYKLNQPEMPVND